MILCVSPVGGGNASDRASIPDPILKRPQTRSNCTYSAGEILLHDEATAEHRMDKCEQLTLWRRNPAIHDLCKLILSSAPVGRRKHPADRETFAHCNKTRFPRWIGISDAATWRNDIPSLSFAPYRLEQRDPAEVRVTLHAHSAAVPCWVELSTGRRALWTG